MAVKEKNLLRIGIFLAAVAFIAAGLAIGRFFRGRSLVDLWLAPDQQGRYYYEKGDCTTAAKCFEDPLWKGIACYKSGDFKAAASLFAQVDTPEGSFNLGDAYVHLGKLEKAEASYSQALRRRPDFKAAKQNLALVQSLIQKEKTKEKKNPPEDQEPSFDPDQVKFDQKGKKGKKGRMEQADLTAEQIRQLWMRRLPTTPSDFLRMKFAVQVQASKPPETDGATNKGR